MYKPLSTKLVFYEKNTKHNYKPIFRPSIDI